MVLGTLGAALSDCGRAAEGELPLPAVLNPPIEGLLIGRSLPILTDFSDFLGRLRPSKTYHPEDLRTLWEWKNRVLLEEYYIFNVVIPLEVE